MRLIELLGTLPFAIALCLCGQAVFSMARPWFRGRPEKVDWVGGLLAMPSRYLVDVHHVVARQPRNARMHSLLAGGFLASLLLLSLSLLFPTSFSLAVSIWIALLVMCAGLRIEHERRTRPVVGLSGGVYARLPKLFAAYIAFACLIPIARLLDGSAAAPVLAAAAAVLGIYGLGGLAYMAGNGPMRHAFAGVTNLVMHRRPERFGFGRSTGLKALNLDSDPLGVAKLVDFTIPQLASFDACVQCGRCEVACPAFAAGLPLNPKKLINDLAESLRGEGATSYAGNGYPGFGAGEGSFSGLPLIFKDGHVSLAPETIWSCTTCRACVEACPMMIEHVDAIVDIRQAQTMQSGVVAPHVQKVLENLRETDTQCGRELSARFDWAADLGLEVIREGYAIEALLWVGESAFDRRAQRTMRSLIKLMIRAGLKPVILGDLERDTGDQARRLGDEATFQRLAKANIQTLNRFDFKYIVTADPHVLHAIRNEYPALGGTFTVRHHTELLAELIEAGRLGEVSKLDSRITYHDPCYLGRYNGEFDAPRRILQRLSADFVEMEKARSNSHCCGGGGGAPLADVSGKRRIPDMRMEQVENTGAGCVAVACPSCTAMLEGVTKASASVMDIAELLEASLEARA